MIETSARSVNLLSLILVLSGGVLSSCTDFLGAGDSVIPEILSAEPADGASGVSVLKTVRIRFNTELNPKTVADGVTLLRQGQEIRARIVLKDGDTLLLEPTDPLDFGTTFEVVVRPSLKSRSGKSVMGGGAWSFSTEGTEAPSLDLQILLSTLEDLADDSMMGRGSGTPDERKAALYLRDRFADYGLVLPLAEGVQDFQALSRRTETLLTSQNVLAVIGGAGALAEEWVVIGAHYDHIGIREQADGSMGINNGADDNASGTAVLLELARVMKSYISSGGMPVDERRSILFAAFGAEEEGLLGSCYYALESPAAPLHRTRAMLNFDMVGRLRGRTLQVGGLETAEGWSNLLENANAPELNVTDQTGCSSCSDFACFRDQGVPYLWFFSGTHDEYHSPADDVELLNIPGMVEVGEVGLRVMTRLVVTPGGPTSLLAGQNKRGAGAPVASRIGGTGSSP